MSLARRIVIAVDDAVIWERVTELVALAEQGEKPEPPSRAVRAISILQPTKHFGWEGQLHQRAVDHAALIYAGRFSLHELSEIASFFEGAVGKKFVDSRDPILKAMTAELNTPDMVEDFLQVVCHKDLRSGPGAGEHGYARRLHPQAQLSANEPAPEWCAQAKNAR